MVRATASLRLACCQRRCVGKDSWLAERYQMPSRQGLDRKPEPVSGNMPLQGEGEEPIVAAGDDGGRHGRPALKRPWLRENRRALDSCVGVGAHHGDKVVG
jgi:hypothetical protein